MYGGLKIPLRRQQRESVNGLTGWHWGERRRSGGRGGGVGGEMEEGRGGGGGGDGGKQKRRRGGGRACGEEEEGWEDWRGRKSRLSGGKSSWSGIRGAGVGCSERMSRCNVEEEQLGEMEGAAVIRSVRSGVSDFCSGGYEHKWGEVTVVVRKVWCCGAHLVER